MGRKRKDIDENSAFAKKLSDLYYETGVSQERLGDIAGASRPTVSEWLSGKRPPNIHHLKNIAQYFNVSADFLLELSKERSPDVSVRAAAGYTGLSDEAVEALHLGLDNQMRGLSEGEKKRRLGLTSELIQSEAFAKMLYNLGEIVEEAYVEKTMKILKEQYLGYRLIKKAYYPIDPVNRDVVIPMLVQVLGESADKLDAMTDQELRVYVTNGEGFAAEHCDGHQYHATKALAGYIEQLMNDSCEKAKQSFGEK